MQLIDELNFTREWLLRNVSDHSAMNHRMQVISHILSSEGGLLKDTIQHITTEISSFREATRLCQYQPSEPIESRRMKSMKWSLLVLLMDQAYDLIALRPGHASLWNHHRGIIILFVNFIKTMLASADLQHLLYDVKALTYVPFGKTYRDLCLQTDDSITVCEGKICIQASCDAVIDKTRCLLLGLLVHEWNMIRHIRQSHDIWNYSDQCRHANRYFLFFCDQVHQYTYSYYEVQVIDSFMLYHAIPCYT